MLTEAQEIKDRERAAREKEAQAIEEIAQAQRDKEALRAELDATYREMGWAPPATAPLRAVVPDKFPETTHRLNRKLAPIQEKNIKRKVRKQMNLSWQADGVKRLLPLQFAYLDYLLLSSTCNTTQAAHDELQAFCRRNSLPVYDNRANLYAVINTLVALGRLLRVKTDEGTKYMVVEGQSWGPKDDGTWLSERIERRNKYIEKSGGTRVEVPEELQVVLGWYMPDRRERDSKR